MPDVGLFTATEPLSKDMKVIIKYSVESKVCRSTPKPTM